MARPSAFACLVAFAVAGLVPGRAQGQTVRITQGDGPPQETRSGDSPALPERATELGDPAAGANLQRAPTSEGLTNTERIWLEIGTGALITGAVGTSAFFLGRAHEDGCEAPCAVDSVFLAAGLGLGAATLLVPLTVTLTGNASGGDGHFTDTLLGYLTGLVVSIVFSSMGSSGGGNAFLIPAAALSSTLPLAGAILAFEASSMRPVGSRGPTLTQ